MFSLTSFAQANMVHNIMHDGENRDYLVHTPIDYNANKDYPLIINMHGLGGNRDQQQLYSQFDRVGDTAGVIIVYPQGLAVNFQGQNQTHWNAGFGTGVDDVGFLTKMLDQISLDYSVDEKRVYSTGMSNGGYMSYYLACEAGDRLTAIASVTGSMVFNVFRNCQPSQSIPALQIHGTRDAVVPFNGNPSIDDVVDFWVDHNNCDMTPTEEMIPDISTRDNTTTIKKTYGGCDNKGEVWYYVVDNGGHTWPGTFPVPSLGNTSADFFASEHIWEFFKQFPANTTSTNDIDLVKGNAYPNPAGEIIHLESANSEVLEAIDIHGQKFQIQEAGEGGSYLIHQLPSGAYFIQDGRVRYSFMKL